MKLTYKLLEKLTDCFAEERKLGNGAFGVVYKGVHENGEEIAVKVFRNMAVDDSEFQKEFQDLRRLKHQNIVELKGYCNESEETLMEYEGQPRLVETLHMALCLEYVDNGSLGEHLSDECQGLNWHLRYKIIKGICEGLKYLRDGLDEPIWHLDLKPGNILLDKNMVPKITDFGLSRLFGEEKIKKTINSVGTCGYWPPEYVKHQVLSTGYDIFSLGVIIVKIMTGHEGYSSIADMTRRKFVQHVHNNWRKKLQEILRHSSLEVYCQQVKTCIDIALKCMMLDRHHRPSIQEIVLNLNETETMIADSGLQIKQFHDEEFIFLSKSNSTSKPSPVTQKDLCTRKKSMGENLQHTSAEPMKLTYQLLQKLTDCFAEERKLGSGTFGVVYKGVHQNGEEIAVKVFRNMAIDDSEFQKEFQNLRRLKHQNIVELKGYCNESEETLMEVKGQQRRVETLHMALCLEYVDNGSLGEHLSDECQGLNWHLRYKIIKGICEGLKYLREGLDEPIWHLDLKPDNILLDKNMVPKIADFGLSRLFGEEKTKKTINSVGTCGYWPPEYVKNQVLSNGYDIFSLGVIIVKIMTGREGYSSIADMTRRKFVQHVHNNWRKKLQEILWHSSLEVYCQQVKTCIDTALKCMMPDRHHRPSIQEIVLNLNETETMVPDNGLPITQFYDEEIFFVSKSNSTSKPSSEMATGASRGKSKESKPSLLSTLRKELPSLFLSEITDGFSNERKLGSGAFGVVYKGILQDGQEIAVKKLGENSPVTPDKQFQNEVGNLMAIQHENIVKLIGFCYETQKKVVEHNGRYILADTIESLLCYEYVQKGSLEKYLFDECSGLEWHTRFGIIRGTCEGLRYLHEGLPSPILHTNLQPRNILLDEKMVPKIGGFGLSRLVDGERTFVTGIRAGTVRYMPPEFIEKGVISYKYDVYSLGVIILEIIAGYMPPDRDYMSSPEFIEIVLKNWRERLQATLKDTWSVERYCHQVKKCIEIALKCLEAERLKRPSIGDIVHVLNETETLIHKQDDPELLDVHPTELFFPFEPQKSISCSLQISNKGDDRVAFRLLTKSSRRYLTKLPLCGVVPPRCTYTLALTMRKQPQPPPSNSDDFFTLQIIELRDLDLEDSIAVDYDNFFKEAEETAGHEVRKVTLTVACGPAEEATSTQIICTQNSRQALSVDVHPTDPWIMTSHYGGSVCIWNYETMATVNSFEISGEPVNSAKFIVREQWFVAGDGNGYIYVYSYDTEEEDILFEAHGERVTSLAVHPTQPYVLSSSDDHLIKLWDWEKGWECTRTFQGHTNRVAQVTFNPNDTNRFTSASLDCKAKIWTLDSPDPDNTVDGHSHDLSCVDYGTRGDRRYLLTGSEDGIAQIWDMETQKCIRKLEGHAGRLSAVYWHPELPILTTGSLDGTVRIWNSTTYRLENVISFNLGAVYAFVYIKGLRRIVVGCHQGIAMMEINLQ